MTTPSSPTSRRTRPSSCTARWAGATRHLYALKEALAEDQAETVTQGLVLAQDTRDSLLFNYEGEKLMAVIGLEGIVVVNTDDALLVVHKDMIPRVKELVNSLEGTELEKYS